VQPSLELAVELPEAKDARVLVGDDDDERGEVLPELKDQV
jgi:hypothetical protein